jgi:hypothetical protein
MSVLLVDDRAQVVLVVELTREHTFPARALDAGLLHDGHGIACTAAESGSRLRIRHPPPDATLTRDLLRPGLHEHGQAAIPRRRRRRVDDPRLVGRGRRTRRVLRSQVHRRSGLVASCRANRPRGRGISTPEYLAIGGWRRQRDVIDDQLTAPTRSSSTSPSRQSPSRRARSTVTPSICQPRLRATRRISAPTTRQPRTVSSPASPLRGVPEGRKHAKPSPSSFLARLRDVQTAEASWRRPRRQGSRCGGPKAREAQAAQPSGPRRIGRNSVAAVRRSRNGGCSATSTSTVM